MSAADRGGFDSGEEWARANAIGAGQNAAALMEIVDEEFMVKYTEAGDSISEVIILMMKRGMTLEVAIGQVHVLVTGLSMKAVEILYGGDPPQKSA